MGSNQPESDVTMELDDSGCVQDDAQPLKPGDKDNGYVGQAGFLDLSDDVLLYILRYCSPHDLKSLGYSCPRLGALVLERSLWARVDIRSVCYGRERTRWLLRHALHAGTKELKLTGLAALARGCQGHVNRTRKDAFEERRHARGDGEDSMSEPETEEPAHRRGPPFTLFRHDMHLPRISSSPCWPESDSEDSDAEQDTGNTCEGPMFTLGQHMLKRLRVQCPRLTSLYLEYCNIDCNKMMLCYLPPTLKRLSLKGSRCYNLPLDKSYLFKIQDYLPDLEYLVLSECAWLEPASLLPLSKLPRLLSLYMCNCPCMQEFVAYVSLATRYGFRKLEILDLRESPVGDSEVSALGWLPALRELYLSAPEPEPPSAPSHHHCIGDRRRRLADTEPWEAQVGNTLAEIPEYYQDSMGREQDAFVPRESDDFYRKQGNMIREQLARAWGLQGFSRNRESFGRNQDGMDSQEPGETSVKITPNTLNFVEDLERDENGERKRKIENGEMDQEAGPSKRPKDVDINETIANIQNSQVTVTKKSGVVCFRRTIFNNITDINERLNDNDDADKKEKNYGEPSPTKDGESGQKKDGEAGPKKDGEAGPKKDGEPCSKMDAQPSPNEDGKPSPNKDDEPSPKRGGETSPKNDGTVCFRRPIFNNVTDINERLNVNDDNDNKKEKGKKDGEPSLKKGGESSLKMDAEPSLTKDGEPNPNKDEKPSPKKDGGSISKNDGVVCFRRTIFNNVTDINERLNVNDESDNQKEKGKKDGEPSPKKGGEPIPKNDGLSPKKDGRQSPKKDGESGPNKDGVPIAMDSKDYVTINVIVSDGASTSNGVLAFYNGNAANTEDKSEDKSADKSDDKSENNSEDSSAGTEQMDLDNEPPTKKMRLENNEKYQEDVDKMSTDESDDSSDDRDTLICFVKDQKNSDATNSSVEKSDGNNSSQNKNSTMGQSVAGSSQSQKQISPSVQSRINRLRRSVGLEPDPNQVGSSNRRQPPPSMEGPSRANAGQPQYVRFRRNQDPIVIPPLAQQDDAQPRHHVLYVNLGQQLHAVYRLLPSRAMPHNRSRSLSAERLDSSSLVSDAAIRRFGRADGDDVNIVNIGPQFIGRDTSTRPNRSNLRVLYATGYRNITNRSLMHLVTASPYLEVVDFTETGVTESGVEEFRSLRPDVQVTWSPFKEEDEE